MRKASTCIVLLVLSGCERAETPAPSKGATAPVIVAPLEVPKPIGGLVPRIEELRLIAKTLPPEPSEAERAEAKDLIEAAFAGSDDSVASLALRRLDRMDHRVMALEEGLSHTDPNVRASCADALRERGDVASLPALILRIRVEQDPYVKLWIGAAMFALHNHSPPAIHALMGALDNAELAENAGAIALQAFAVAKLEMPAVPTWDDVRKGLRALGEHWDREGFALGTEPPAYATIEDLDPRLRAILASNLVQLSEFQLRPVDYAREILRRLGVLPLPLLKLCLTASESYVRAHVVEIVRDIGRPARSLSGVVLPLLDDPLTRLSATQAIGRFKDLSAAPRVRASLQGDDLDLAIAAAEALGEMGDLESRSVLLSLMENESKVIDLRVYCAFGLARLEHGGAGEAFLRAQLAAGKYHEPTVKELLDRIAIP